MQTPHDRFFQEMFEKKVVAEDFLKNYLPQELLDLINLDKLQISKKSFVNKCLKKYFSDVVYRVELNKQNAYIYWLFEHKSYPDKDVSFQLLQYMVRIWEHHQDHYDEEKLPLVIPLLIYHGGKRYNIDKRFSAKFNIQANTEKFIPDFEHLLFDFSKYSDLEIIGSIQLQIVLKILHTSFIDNDYDKIFADILKLIKKLNDTKTILEYFTTGMKYILEIKDYDFDIMHDKVNLIIPERSETFMSTANKLREEGKLDGIKEGMKEGMKEGRKQELIETISILIKDKLPIDKLPDNLESKLNKLDLIVLREIRTDLLKDIITIESLEDLEEYLN
ncbi:Rpn family recombination-promoting nuclease/putative transposase [Halanaerobium sp. ST460_2HS_T2]|uniref:Rpn family recombination-promoting nuclease/putative transposase n=1 Tax=Halanaerobium sp. ST460_2HS_T2 TaxID=2183914 RepID=UPI000DF397E6|nr:Rpn family recombination-promoting nuclease/putative transposase [Halanaerobium sp. ST460_2HS_T2]RCW53398.1 putative transposase/invertase (TIGR01784 family) [Halanaerobium sp. ST460_2HS_T2]